MSRSLLVHLLPLEISFQGIQKQPIMWHTVPIEDLLFLLRTYTVVLVHEIKERTLWLFEGRICARLQIPQV